MFPVLSPHQSVFRAKHSTAPAITSVTNDIISDVDKEKDWAALIVSLTKAFDTVDHALLIWRLCLF